MKLAMFKVAWGLVLLGGACAAQAQVYTCTTAEGRRITSDRPIPECLDREQRQLNTVSGHAKVVPPRQTDAERLAVEEARKKELRAAKVAEYQARENRLLLLRYPTEIDLELQREYLLDAVRKRWQPVLDEQAEIEQERKALQAKSQAAQKSGQATDSEDAKAAIRLERRSQQIKANVQKAYREMAQINQKMDAERDRLRQAMAEQEHNRAVARGLKPVDSKPMKPAAVEATVTVPLTEAP